MNPKLTDTVGAQIPIALKRQIQGKRSVTFQASPDVAVMIDALKAEGVITSRLVNRVLAEHLPQTLEEFLIPNPLKNGDGRQ